MEKTIDHKNIILSEKNITYHFAPYHFLPQSISSLIRFRNDNLKEEIAIINGINASIILSTTALIESFNKETLRNRLQFNIERSNIEEENPLKIIINGKIEDIEQSEWKFQKEIFKDVFTKKLSDLIEPTTLEGMNILFLTRNLLTHGNKLFASRNNEKKKETTWEIKPMKFQKIISYLSKKIKNFEITDWTEIYGSKSIDHFIEIANNYFKEINILLETGSNKSPFVRNIIIKM